MSYFLPATRIMATDVTADGCFYANDSLHRRPTLVPPCEVGVGRAEPKRGLAVPVSELRCRPSR